MQATSTTTQGMAIWVGHCLRLLLTWSQKSSMSLLSPYALLVVLNYHSRPAMKLTSHYKGNKEYLPSKPCLVCGREMTWRKSWAKNWDQVQYCSNACRKKKTNNHHGQSSAYL